MFSSFPPSFFLLQSRTPGALASLFYGMIPFFFFLFPFLFFFLGIGASTIQNACDSELIRYCGRLVLLSPLFSSFPSSPPFFPPVLLTKLKLFQTVFSSLSFFPFFLLFKRSGKSDCRVLGLAPTAQSFSPSLLFPLFFFAGWYENTRNCYSAGFLFFLSPFSFSLDGVRGAQGREPNDPNGFFPHFPFSFPPPFFA